MLYRKIGSSDLEVSEICLGSWLTYGGASGASKAEACVAKAFELGINFIDTANAYSGGEAESFLGEVLADRPRNSYVLATKLFFPMTRKIGACRESRSSSRSTRHSRACGWTTSTSTSVIATTGIRHSPRRWRRSPRSSSRARRAISASASGGGQDPGGTLASSVEKFVSSQPQYSLLWRGPELDVIHSALTTGSRRSCSRRCHREC